MKSGGLALSLGCDGFDLLGCVSVGLGQEGLCQARLDVCEAELGAGFLTEGVIEQPGCGLNIFKRCPRLSPSPSEGV